MSERIRHVITTAAVLAIAMTGGCAKATPTAPATVGASVPLLPPTPTLRIVGLPESVQKNSRTALTAEIVSTGVEPCPLQQGWSIDNDRLAFLAPSPAELYVKYSGYVTVTATCGALTASQRVRIEEPAPVAQVYDSIVGGAAYAGAEIELLEGARKGERFAARAFHDLDRTGLVFPLRARLTARFFETRDFEFSAGTSQGMARGYGSPDSQFSIPMTFVGDANTESYVCCNVPRYGAPLTYPFATKATGLIEVSFYHYLGDTSRNGVDAELWCGGALAQRKSNQDYGDAYAGTLIRVQVTGPAACEVRVVPGVSQYRIAITYPR